MNEAAKKKLEQLQQAVSVLDKVIDQCSWASDMTDYQDISEQMDSVLDVVDTAKSEIESLITDLEYQMEEFQEKHDEFLMENEVKV
jgi:peroxiredoxin family protein